MSGLTLWSDAWFSRAVARLDGVRFGDVDLDIEYRCEDTHAPLVHGQMFRDGRLVEWRRGRIAQPDLVLVQPSAVNLAMLTRRMLGNAMLAATSIVDPEAGTVHWPPPLDEIRCNWATGLPLVPTLPSFDVLHIMTESPFGLVSTYARFDQGRLLESGLGWPAAPAIVVERIFARALRHRAGEMDALTSIEGGDLSGDFRVLSSYLGLVDSDEYIEARKRLASPYYASLISLAQILCSPPWQEIADAIASGTSDMESVP